MLAQPSIVHGSASLDTTNRPLPSRLMRATRRGSGCHAAFLAEASKRLAGSLDLQLTLRCMAELSVPNLGDACVVCLLAEGGARPGEVGVAKHVDASREGLLTTVAHAAFGEPRRWQPLLSVACSARPAVLSQLATALLLGDGGPPHVLLGELRVRRAMLVPVAIRRERPLAVAIFLSDRAQGYAPVQVRLAQEIAGRFALALESAQMYRACRTALEDRQESIATTVHDLMSPLAYIKGTTQRLRRIEPVVSDPAASLELRRRLEAIDSTITRIASDLSALVQDSRPEPAGWCQRVTERTDLVALIRQVVAAERLIAREHSIGISEAQPVLQGAWDAHHLERMLENLIGNAVKYSPPGSLVEVSSTSAVDCDGQWAVLRIADHGIGIPAGDLPFVFEPYQRGSNVGGVGGTGLGLASVWQTVKTHDGRLSVESEEGRGTCVTVRLPLGGRTSSSGSARSGSASE
jgi:signal transduction histidine kinase